jgi:hypothetical protein
MRLHRHRAAVVAVTGLAWLALGSTVAVTADSPSIHPGLARASLAAVNDPKAGTSRFEGTLVLGLADNGVFAGDALKSNHRTLGFIHRDGNYVTFKLGPEKHGGTEVDGVNSDGEVVGSYRIVVSATRRYSPLWC